MKHKAEDTERGGLATPKLTHYAETNLPTEHGVFRVIVFQEEGSDKEHLAIICGEIQGGEGIPIRVHSECFTGEVLHSMKCDCREQLQAALQYIAGQGQGMVIYLRQEGRGIGLGNKIRAYALQEQGADTVDANRLLGFGDDLRTYEVAHQIITHLKLQSVKLLTNNPLKLQKLAELGVTIEERLPIFCEPNMHSLGYFRAKKARMGHMFDSSLLNQAKARVEASLETQPHPDEQSNEPRVISLVGERAKTSNEIAEPHVD